MNQIGTPRIEGCKDTWRIGRQKGARNSEVQRYPQIGRGYRDPKIEKERQRPKIEMVQRCPIHTSDKIRYSG